ncbi:MAG: ATP-binding protein [Bacteroidota bacterium]
MNVAKEKADESNSLKSAFLSNMSHEIRTPMNGILGFSELLKNPNLSSNQQQEFIEIIQKSGDRMLNIINDIIDISKIESGQMSIKIKEINISEQLDYTYSFFKNEVKSKPIKLSIKKDSQLTNTIIETDGEKVYAVLTNLVKNAVKFTKQGSIEFGYRLKEKFIEYYVKDTGIGIPKDRQTAIFERFVQADIHDTKAYQGAGLGLAISKAYVQMLGGEIWVESEEDKGSQFYFTIPCNIINREVYSVENLISDKTKNSQKGNLKILIVEDNDISQLVILKMVESFSREVLVANNGLEAVELCQNNPDLDLVLMDVKIPKIDGHQATKKIREFNKDLIIIAQTAYGLADDREKAMESGCNDYVSKPIKQELLLSLIQKYFKN